MYFSDSVHYSGKSGSLSYLFYQTLVIISRISLNVRVIQIYLNTLYIEATQHIKQSFQYLLFYYGQDRILFISVHSYAYSTQTLYLQHEMHVCTIPSLLSSHHIQREKGGDRLGYMQKDSSPNSSHSNSISRYSNTNSTPLKLIYII